MDYSVLFSVLLLCSRHAFHAHVRPYFSVFGVPVDSHVGEAQNLQVTESCLLLISTEYIRLIWLREPAINTPPINL